VVQNQRDRIAAGMIAVVVERGYAATTVTAVVAAAGISRRTFYNYYTDKAAAFFDVYRQVTDFLCTSMREAGDGITHGGWAARVKAGIEALLQGFAANPDLVRFTLEAPRAAGGEVDSAYREFLERLLAVVAEGRPKSARRPPPAAEYGAIGGFASLVIAATDKGGPKALLALLPELTELVLTPYLGRDAAIKTAR
jgi:AcrR family transcriptional regulator